MRAITRPRNKNLGPNGRNRFTVGVIVDVSMMPFGHKHHRPVDWAIDEATVPTDHPFVGIIRSTRR